MKLIRIDSIEFFFNLLNLRTIYTLSENTVIFVNSFMSYFASAENLEEVNKDWINMKTEILKGFNSFKDSLIKALKSVDLDYFEVSYSDKLVDFSQNIENKDYYEVQSNLSLFKEFSNEVAQILKAFSSYRNVVLKFNEVNTYLGEEDSINWDELRHAIDKVEERFHEFRNKFMLDHKLVYLSIAIQKFLIEARNISQFYESLQISIENRKDLEGALILLVRIFTKSEDIKEISLIPVLNYTLGKYYLEQKKTKEAINRLSKSHIHFRGFKDSQDIVKIRGDILSLVRDQSTIKKAEKFALDIIKSAQSNYDLVLEGLTSIALFQRYMNEKQYEKAEDILREAVRCSNEGEDETLTIIVDRNVQRFAVERK